MERGRLAIVLSIGAACGCTPMVARPVFPRGETAGPMSIRLDHLRKDRVAIAVKGSERVSGAWLHAGAVASATCGAGVAATAIGPEQHGLEPQSGDEILVEMQFPGAAMTDFLAQESTLSVEVASDPPACLRVPLAGSDPKLTYQLGSGGGPWNAGMNGGAFVPLSGKNDVGWGVFEWNPFRISRWTGPVRPTVDVGLAFVTRMFSLHTGAMLMAFPLVFRHAAVGVGAGYEVRPSWLHDSVDGDRFKWVHGPRVELDLVYINPPLLGFPPHEKLQKLGIGVWAARLDADHFAATVLGLSLVRN